MLYDSLFQRCASAQRSNLKARDLECGDGICIISHEKSQFLPGVKWPEATRSCTGPGEKVAQGHKVVGENTSSEDFCQNRKLVTQTQPMPTHLSVAELRPTSPLVVAYYSSSLSVVMLYDSLFQHCESAQRSGLKTCVVECGGGICTILSRNNAFSFLVLMTLHK